MRARFGFVGSVIRRFRPALYLFPRLRHPATQSGGPAERTEEGIETSSLRIRSESLHAAKTTGGSKRSYAPHASSVNRGFPVEENPFDVPQRSAADHEVHRWQSIAGLPSQRDATRRCGFRKLSSETTPRLEEAAQLPPAFSVGVAPTGPSPGRSVTVANISTWHTPPKRLSVEELRDRSARASGLRPPAIRNRSGGLTIWQRTFQNTDRAGGLYQP
jgi:hypothetical protein